MITETTDGVNISGNQLSIDCITSNQDKFHLDSDGNLTVNSITTIQNNPSGINLDTIYPIGSIYMNTTDINPSTLFGGTWEKISQGRTLIGVDENDTDFNVGGKIGGEKTHLLTKSELPAIQPNIAHSGGNINVGSGRWVVNSVWTSSGAQYSGNPMLPIGYGGAHNNMPPYLTVYMWKRIS